jgi:nephrocystin-3
MPPSSHSGTEFRVFISSTFIDFQDERDYLAKKVFPGLRQLARERGVEFTEIDLRWGLTDDDSKNGRILRTCLEEIDNCRPFFVGLLGERCGWVPSAEELAKDAELRQKQPWLDDAAARGQSVTEMEMRHGFLNAVAQGTLTEDNKPLIYFRKPRTAAGEEKRVSYLKAEITSALGDIPNFDAPSELGEMLDRDLRALIEKHWPHKRQESWLEKEQSGHAAFAQSRRKAYVADAELTEKILSGVAGQDSVIVVSGDSGGGKSSLLAYIAEQFRASEPDLFVIEHYIGVTATSTDPDTLLRRIIEETRLHTGAEDAVPQTSDELARSLPAWLAKMGSTRLLIFIDAINQFSATGSGSHLLGWLPEHIPANIKLVISSTECEALDRLRARKLHEINVPPITINSRRKVLQTFLAGYQKKRAEEQEDRIISDPKASSPLFLRTLLEELRLQGVHQELDRQIEYYLASRDIPELFTRILERVESDFGRTPIERILTRLWAAPQGLSESEILAATEIDRATLSLVLHAFDYHFVRVRGRLSFFHDHLRLAIERRYLPTPRDKRMAWATLATYFEDAEVTAMKAYSLPWLWRRAERWQELRRALLDLALVPYLAESSRTYDLLGYWRALIEEAHKAQSNGHVLDVVALYDAAVQASHPEERSELDVRRKLSTFFRDAGWFGGAIAYGQRALELEERAPLTQETLGERIDLFLELGTAYIDGGDLAKASDVLDRAVEIAAIHFEPLDPRSIRVRSEYARLLFKKANYVEAERVIRDALASGLERYGKDHAIVHRAMGVLAETLEVQQKLAEAESIYRDLLERIDLTLGPESLAAAEAANGLALFLLRSNAGSFDEALSLYQRTLKTLESALGPNHPDVGTVLNNLASLYVQNNKLEEAEPIFQRGIEIDKTSHGIEHPKTATSLHNYALLLEREQKWEEAEKVYRESLEIRRKVLGEDHNITAISYNNLANLLLRVQKLDEAETFYRRALDIRLAAFGPEHLNTARTMFGYGRLLRAKQDFVKAADILTQGYTIRKNGLGPVHRDTLAVGFDLIQTLIDQCQKQQARELIEEIEHSAEASSLPDDLKSRITTLREAI